MIGFHYVAPRTNTLPRLFETASETQAKTTFVHITMTFVTVRFGGNVSSLSSSTHTILDGQETLVNSNVVIPALLDYLKTTITTAATTPSTPSEYQLDLASEYGDVILDLCSK